MSAASSKGHDVIDLGCRRTACADRLLFEDPRADASPVRSVRAPGVAPLQLAVMLAAMLGTLTRSLD